MGQPRLYGPRIMQIDVFWTAEGRQLGGESNSGARVFRTWYLERMVEISDTRKLSGAVSALVVTIAEIINEKLRVSGEVQEQKIARTMIEPLLKKKELAEHLGVSGRTVDNWISKGYLPYYRLGRNVRFKLSDVESCWNQHYRVVGGGWGRGPNRARRGI